MNLNPSGMLLVFFYREAIFSRIHAKIRIKNPINFLIRLSLQTLLRTLNNSMINVLENSEALF